MSREMECLNREIITLCWGNTVSSIVKKFHFQEIDLTICFSNSGNEKKKYANYNVRLEKNQSNTSALENQLSLGEVLDQNDFANGYPHTVGFYKASNSEEKTLKPEYLEIRRIRGIEEFWNFLNELDM
jgi:hypothetical protein